MPSETNSSLRTSSVEESFDLWFYRPLGYRIAAAANRFGLHPNHLSLACLLFGLAGTHCFYYPGWLPALLGILLTVTAETLDSSDGQLARLSGKASRSGKIMDGLADHGRNTSLYLHLGARMALATGPLAGWLLAVAAGFSHAAQSALCAYRRMAYERFCCGDLTALGSARQVEEDARRQEHWLDRFMLHRFATYLRNQERLSPTLRPLLEATARGVPEEMAQAYDRLNRKLLADYWLLGANLRMGVLFLAIALQRPEIALWFEVVALNLVALQLHRRQTRADLELTRRFLG